MNRRHFLSAAGAGGTALAGAAAQPASSEPGVVVERKVSGKPRAGKVLAAIQPHCDDIPLFAGGTVLKLLDEGCTGYLIRITNDDMAGPGTIAETVMANERDHDALVRVMGFRKGFSLNYSNHQMDGISKPELRSRLIFLFRLLKVDTVVCYDPWGHYEENPDHYVTAQCVEAACWMAGGGKDYPEHFEAGLQPHGVREKYYFARGPQLVNRVVDITPSIDRRIDAMLVNKAHGPAGDNGARLRASLARRNLKLPVLGDSDDAANRNYARQFLLTREQDSGRPYGLQYAEAFHYIAPHRPSVLDRQGTRGAVRARVVRGGDRLRDAAAENLRSVEGIVPVVIRRDENTGSRVNSPLPKSALSHGVIPLVLVKNGRQGEDNQVVAACLIQKAAPVIFSVAGQALAQLRVGIGCLSHQRSDAHEDKRRVVEAVLRGDFEGFFGCGRRRNGPGADRAVVRHHAQNALGLLLGDVGGRLRILRTRRLVLRQAHTRREKKQSHGSPSQIGQGQPFILDASPAPAGFLEKRFSQP